MVVDSIAATFSAGDCCGATVAAVVFVVVVEDAFTYGGQLAMEVMARGWM